MPFYKTTWFFSCSQTGIISEDANLGWSETWYQSAADLEAALVFAANVLDPNSWINRRLDMLHNIYRIAFVRVSEVGVPRNTKIATLFPTRGNLPTAPAVDPPAQATCCVLVDAMALPFVNLGAVHRRFMLRGLPSSWINGNVLALFGLNIRNLYRFLDLVARGQSGVAPNPNFPLPIPPWLVRQTLPNPRVNILTAIIDPTSPHRIIITTALPLSLVPGAVAPGVLVRIARMGGFALVNRLWTVRDYDSATLKLTLEFSRVAIAGAWNGQGTAQLTDYTYRPLNQYTVGGLRVRHTGRPPRLTRGRRRVSV